MGMDHGIYPTTLDGQSLTLIKEEDFTRKRQANARNFAHLDETRHDGSHKDQNRQAASGAL